MGWSRRPDRRAGCLAVSILVCAAGCAPRRERLPPGVMAVMETEQTASFVRNFNPLLEAGAVRWLQNNVANSYKKKAIETGIAAATGELIVTTDADCYPPQEWLEMIAAFRQEKEAVLIAAPVVIDCNSTFVQMFQAMDFMVLQGITGAAVYKRNLTMCNGANLAYERKVFNEVNGFAGVDHIASGDDMLLMHKIVKKYPRKVHYLKSKEAIVSTQPMKTWKDFFNQRIRWASKARQYDDKRIFPCLLLVYLFNLSILLSLIAGFWNHRYLAMLVGAYGYLKTLIEFPFFIFRGHFFQ